MQPFSSTTSHSHWAAQRLSSNSPSRYYVLEKILIPIVLYANRGDGDFFFLSLENIVGRRNASPPGDKRKRKPEPDIYLHALDLLGLPANRCCCVEDSVPGITAGKRAGLTVIAKREGRFGFSQDAADKIIDQLPELLELA